jgi:hypothetical protein
MSTLMLTTLVVHTPRSAPLQARWPPVTNQGTMEP